MTWDRKIDYNTACAYYTAQRDYEKEEYFRRRKKRHAKRYAYYTILLTQLVNRCNISEAVEGLYKACNGLKPQVRKRKSKNKKISLKIPDTNYEICEKHVKYLYNGGDVKTALISTWSLKNTGYNTHSNKYAR